MSIDLTSGVDVALRRTPGGKFDLDFITSGPGKGNPRLSNDRVHAVVATLHSHKRGRRPGQKTATGGYYYDTSGRRGSLLWTVSLDRGATRGELLAAAQDAGQQLVDERIITTYQVDATRKSLAKWALAFAWTLPSGDRKDQTF